MVNDINEVIAGLARIDNASAMIMESTRKEKAAYSVEIKEKTKAFDAALSSGIDEKASALEASLEKENQQLINQCRTESEQTIKNMDSRYETYEKEWIEGIFNNIIKE